MYDYRTNILFSKNQIEVLQQIAAKSNKTIGQLVRTAVDKTYQKRHKKQSMTVTIKKMKILAKRAKHKNMTMGEILSWRHYGHKQ
jgi:hypothetical protein